MSDKGWRFSYLYALFSQPSASVHLNVKDMFKCLCTAAYSSKAIYSTVPQSRNLIDGVK